MDDGEGADGECPPVLTRVVVNGSEDGFCVTNGARTRLAIDSSTWRAGARFVMRDSRVAVREVYRCRSLPLPLSLVPSRPASRMRRSGLKSNDECAVPLCDLDMPFHVCHAPPRPVGLHARTPVPAPGPRACRKTKNEARGRGCTAGQRNLNETREGCPNRRMPDPDGGVTVRHGDGGAVQ